MRAQANVNSAAAETLGAQTLIAAYAQLCQSFLGSVRVASEGILTYRANVVSSRTSIPKIGPVIPKLITIEREAEQNWEQALEEAKSSLRASLLSESMDADSLAADLLAQSKALAQRKAELESAAEAAKLGLMLVTVNIDAILHETIAARDAVFRQGANCDGCWREARYGAVKLWEFREQDLTATYDLEALSSSHDGAHLNKWRARYEGLLPAREAVEKVWGYFDDEFGEVLGALDVQLQVGGNSDDIAFWIDSYLDKMNDLISLAEQAVAVLTATEE